MSFFSKSEAKPPPAVNYGHVLFPPPNSNEQSADGTSGAILRDGKITFDSSASPASPSVDGNPDAQR